jgi:hypothetical protein
VAGDEFIWCGWKRVHGSSGANSSLSPNEVSRNINRQRIELAANATLRELSGLRFRAPVRRCAAAKAAKLNTKLHMDG